MNTTTTRPSTTVAIQQAAAQGTSSRPRDGCKDCVKTGLAILPVISTPVPVALRGTSPELTHLDGRLDTADLKAHWFIMRTLPSGYLYVMKPDLTWDAYVVDTDGLLRMMAVANVPADPAAVMPMSQACTRQGDNLPAQVIAIDPARYATIWMAFSRYRWTAKVLADYAANKQGCRDRRMTMLDVMAAAAGSLGATSTAANAVRFGAAMTPQVSQYVADYTSSATRELLNKHLVTPLRDRSEQGASLAAKMAQISRQTASKTGAIILLNDDLGSAADLNTLRNAETSRLAAYLSQNQRKRFVGEVIQGLEKAYVDNGQADAWKTRFKPKYKATQIKNDRAAFDAKAQPWEKRINAMSDDVASLNARPSLKAWWRDFDPADDHSSKDRQRATALCLHGAVKTKAEQALWDQWFNEEPSDPYATLWGAVTAMDANLGAYLVGKQLPDVGKTDKFADIAKNIREAVLRHRERLKARAADDALALIGLSMASQVSRLKVLKPDLYKVAGMRVLIAASVRTTVTATPAFMSVTRMQEALMLAEAAFGPPEASVKRLLDIEASSSKRVFVVGSNGVDAYAWEGQQTTTQKARVVEVWLPEELAKELPALPAPALRLALPPPKVNPFLALVKFTKSVPGAFAWVGLTLQALNLGNSAKDWADSKVSDKTDAYFGVASGVLGVSGVMAEIAAGTMERVGARFAATTVARVALAGGALASLSALAEGLQAGVKSSTAASAGDLDAAVWYGGSSVLLFASGIAGFGGALAIASSAGALAGGLAVLAPAGAAAAAVPVAGWIAAGVIFLGMGLALLWQAIKATDTPLEVWLLGCIYGTGSKPLSERAEMETLNDVMYAMSIEVEWSEDVWELQNTNFYDDYDNFRFAISLPGAGANSVIECKVVLLGKNGRQQIFHETIRPRMQGNMPIDPHVPVISAAPLKRPETLPNYIWWEPPRISDAGKRYGGQLKLDDSVYSGAEVDIKYWPDSERMPSFVLPRASEQRTLTAAD